LSKLDKLLSLANNPGSESEGQSALEKAQAEATKQGLQITESPEGEHFIAVEAWRAEYIERLHKISDGNPTAGNLGQSD
jgi:hypothetical protein